MKVDDHELVVQFHILFNKEESDFLRSEGFLHPQSAECTEMWMTMEDISLMVDLYPDLQKPVGEIMEEILRRGFEATGLKIKVKERS